jgi:hypothetical protein
VLPSITTPCIVINQQGAARGEMLVALLLHHPSARRSRKGGAVLQTSPCTVINQQVGAELRNRMRGADAASYVRMDIASKLVKEDRAI